MTLPPNVTVVNFYIQGCTSLERYIIPAAVKTIRSSSIRDVGSNIRLIIGDPINGSSLNTVGAYWTFRSVKIMVLYATTPPSYTGSYQADFSSLTALYVPDESVEAYKSTGHWSKVASKIKPLSEYVEN